MMRWVRPKKLRKSIKPQTHRANSRRIKAIVEDLDRTLLHGFGYFKHAKAKLRKKGMAFAY